MTNDPVTPEIARQVLQEHDSRRSEECQRAISDALLRFACILVPEIIITGNQITASVRILPRPRSE
ncbi:MAG TPA: hypothetical protein VM537_12980 [Anaerolineae bacterium]|jgi:hypothetical protein|nr:hypothetical protein [Anaerolineae bacterium]